MKSFYSESNRKYCYGPYREYTKYNYDTCSNTYYDVLEYYPVRIYLHQGIKSNFKMISNRLVLKCTLEIEVVNRLCLCEYSLNYFIIEQI